METINYVTEGVCSDSIEIKIEAGIIKSISFEGGCSGNLSGIARLCVGMSAREAAEKLGGIPCGDNETSCPDQLAKALSKYL